MSSHLTEKASICAEHVVMRFEDRVLFSFPKLTFSQGDVIYLQGDNGTGKSTLMRLLAGFINAPEGKLSAHGFTKTPWWRKQSLLGKAVYLHQHPYVFDGTVKYNLTYAASQSKLSPQALKARIEQAIEMAQLRHLLGSTASDLSGGERQRLAIARAWITQPALLMLDEPISNMDKPSQRLILAMIEQLKHDGTGLLLSSHQTCGLTALCHQHWHIHQQQITVNDHLPSISGREHHQTSELHYVNAN